MVFLSTIQGAVEEAEHVVAEHGVSVAEHAIEEVGHAAANAVPMGAVHVFESKFFVITDAMIYTWLIALLILIFVRLGTRKMKEVPSGLQNFIEFIVDGLEKVGASLLPRKVAQWSFPVLATFFLFILVSNWMGLFPGVGSIGLGGHPVESALPFAVGHVAKPFFRPPTSDANMTLAMGIVFFVMSFYWTTRYNGIKGTLHHLFGVKGGLTGALAFVLSFIFILVGFIEIISILIRPLALAVRLYGNIYGGENVITIMLKMLPFGLAAIPFYFLELVIGLVQALVFTMLSLAFTATMCSHEHGEEHEGHEGHAEISAEAEVQATE